MCDKETVMRVAMFIQGYYPLLGGAERQLASLAPRLQARGVDVHVITRRYPGLVAFEMVDGVPVHRMPIPGNKITASLGFTISSILQVRRLRPAVLHAHELLSPTTTAVSAKRLLGIPVVAKPLRGGRLGDIQRLQRMPFGARRLATFRRSVDAFIVISREIDAELDQVGVPPARRVFIPNGVDTERFTPLPPREQSAPLLPRDALRESLGLPDGPVAVFSGRLAPEKRVDRLLGVWPAVRAACAGATLLVLGSGPEAARLREMAAPGVRFAGQIDDVAPYLQAADLFVLPSVAEGLSNALLEAMAAGLPTIVTAVGAAGEVIEHGYDGWLIQPDDEAGLQAALIGLLGDATQRTSLGRNARQRVLQRYGLDRTADRLCELYAAVVSGSLPSDQDRGLPPPNARHDGEVAR
jgi:glycosyltransferase involved in cell wall biosynthesis